jgi:AcrR family transcriptional regulator
LRAFSYHLAKFELVVRILGLSRLTVDSPATSASPYRAHRERQRRRILTAAQELFDARGIDRVTIAEIVSGTGIRASTLYEYFANKDEIVWALVEDVLRHGAERIQKAMEEAGGPALKKIAALFQVLEEELKHNPARVRFMAQFDAMYARDWSVERLLSIEERIMPGRFGGLADLIREGKADGSLRADLDPDLTLHSMLNAVIGTQRRLASLGDRVEKEYGQPVHLLFRETVRVILLGLKAP